VSAVRFVFTQTGADSIEGALESIASKATGMKGKVEGAFNATGRAAQNAARTTVSAEDKRWKEIEKTGARIEREFARETKAAERAAQQRVRAEEKAAKQIAAANLKANQQATAATVKRWEHEKKLAAQHARAAARQQPDRPSALGALAVGGAALAVVGTALAVGKQVASTIGSAARESMALGAMANRVAINAGLAGENVDAAKMKRAFEDVAIATPGIKSEEVGAAALAFQSKTGRAADKQTLQTLATVSSASGSSIEDVANASAALSEKFDIKNVDQLREALTALIEQGAKGAYELKDAAANYDKMTAAAQRFGLNKGVEGVKVLGGLSQLARGSTGSAEQATTAVEASLRQLVAKSSDLEKDYGVKVFSDEGHTKTRDVRDVLVDTISKSKGSLPELQKVFGDEGIRGVSPLITAYNQAHNASGANTEAGKAADGIKALRAMLDGAINAGGDWSTTVKAAAQAQSDASGQLDAAWEQLKQQVGEAVVPELIKMVPHISRLVAVLPPVVEFFGKLVAMGDALLEMLEAAGIIPNKKAYKSAPKGKELEAVNKEIESIESNPAPTLEDVRRAQALRAHRTELTADLPINVPKAQPHRSGFAGVANVPATPLTGIEAVAAVVQTPAEGEAAKLDTTEAQKGAADLARATVDAAQAIGEAVKDLGGSGDDRWNHPSITSRTLPHTP